MAPAPTVTEAGTVRASWLLSETATDSPARRGPPGRG